MFLRIAKGDDELGEEVADSAVGDVGCGGVENECPCQRVCEGFFQLVHFEVLVSDALLVDADTFDGKATVFFAQPACVELVVGHEEKKENTDYSCEETRDKEDDFPR